MLMMAFECDDRTAGPLDRGHGGDFAWLSPDYDVLADPTEDPDAIIDDDSWPAEGSSGPTGRHARSDEGTPLGHGEVGGTVYIAANYEGGDVAEEDDSAAGGGVPPVPPPQPPRGGGYADGDPGEGGDEPHPGESVPGSSWFSQDRPGGDARPGELAPLFVPEGELLRRTELLHRVATVVSFLVGAGEGHRTAAALRAERTAELARLEVGEAGAPSSEERRLPDQPPLLAEPALRTPQETERVFVAPEADSLPDLPARLERIVRGPNFDTGPSSEVLRRVAAGLRAAAGQEDMAVKEDLGTVEVEELTPEEIAAAGGDRMVALANRLTAMQEGGGRHRANDDPGQ